MLSVTCIILSLQPESNKFGKGGWSKNIYFLQVLWEICHQQLLLFIAASEGKAERKVSVLTQSISAIKWHRKIGAVWSSLYLHTKMNNFEVNVRGLCGNIFFNLAVMLVNVQDNFMI